MATSIVRFRASDADAPAWGTLDGDAIAPCTGDYATTRELIESGEGDWRGAKARAPRVPVASVELMSPVTVPARILCQGANYREHARESGMDPGERSFNMIFNKSDASLHAPQGEIVRPAHVKLLDYEVELGLVFGTVIDAPLQKVTLPDVLFGLVLANDVSARDVQLPQLQFFKGKSYPTFCPVGPRLVVPDADEWGRLGELELRLAVNGTERQSALAGRMIFGPEETIAELATFTRMEPGDLLLTGTPSGCALRPPRPAVQRFARALLPEEKLWRMFIEKQSRRREYLQPGDTVTASIRTADGALDLGTQEHVVRAAA